MFAEALGVRNTKFDELRAAGVVPPPDGWLGPRLPFWTAGTVRATQAKFVGTERPVE